jgi:hypothetical protein
LNITLTAEKALVLRSILTNCERFTLEGELAVHRSTGGRAEVGQGHQILQVVSESARAVAIQKRGAQPMRIGRAR